MKAPNKLYITANHNKLIITLYYITITLVACNLIACYLRNILGYESAFTFIQKFYMDSEGNIPSFFSTFIILLSSFIFYLIAKHKKANNDIFYKHWFGLSIVFFILSCDEGFQLHELLSIPLNKLNPSGIFLFSWVIAGLFIIAIFTILYLRFFLSLSNTYKVKFSISAIIFLSGAVVLEMYGGWYVQNYGRQYYIYPVLFTIEETLEIIGIIYLIDSLLDYIKNDIIKIVITINDAKTYKFKSILEKSK